jgi:uncharacterized protein
MLRFEWDSEKAKSNADKHGVTFDEAVLVFDDPQAIIRMDGRFAYGEERFVIIGSSGIRVLAVAHTERDEVIRIISARRATRQEVNAYAQRED